MTGRRTRASSAAHRDPRIPRVPALLFTIVTPTPRVVGTTIVLQSLLCQSCWYAPVVAAEDSVVRAWASLHFAYREMSKLVDERLRAEAECSLSDMDVLNELACTPDHRLQMLDLADRLGVTRGGLTRIIDRLVERGWVSRDRPEHNRREVYGVITDDGA